MVHKTKATAPISPLSTAHKQNLCRASIKANLKKMEGFNFSYYILQSESKRPFSNYFYIITNNIRTESSFFSFFFVIMKLKDH